LYGKTDASNSEVNNAAEIANCKEFIENNGIAKFNDTAE
jgi:ABC-type multidrug transport system fused ATPase/permease subunit